MVVVCAVAGLVAAGAMGWKVYEGRRIEKRLRLLAGGVGGLYEEWAYGPSWYRKLWRRWLPATRRVKALGSGLAKDADMEYVAKVRSLRVLVLRDCPVSDAGIAKLTGLGNL